MSQAITITAARLIREVPAAEVRIDDALIARTVEGIASVDDKGVVHPSPVQKAFLEHYSFQCGYCTPGFVNSATVLVEKLEKHPVPADDVEKAIEEQLEAHICRCTGYVRYYHAVRDVILKTPGLTTGKRTKEVVNNG